MVESLQGFDTTNLNLIKANCRNGKWIKIHLLELLFQILQNIPPIVAKWTLPIKRRPINDIL
jgi:hypothetical protein